MTQEEIQQKAYEVYPLDLDRHLIIEGEPYDNNKEKREAYIRGLTDSKPELPSELDEAAEEEAVKDKAKVLFDSLPKFDIGEEKNRILLGLLELEAFALLFYGRGKQVGTKLLIKELFKKLDITPLKVIGKDENDFPIYDFKEGRYYRTFTLFGQKYKIDQTAAGQAGAEWMAGQGINLPAHIFIPSGFKPIYDYSKGEYPAAVHLDCGGSLILEKRLQNFNHNEEVIVQIRKK